MVNKLNIFGKSILPIERNIRIEVIELFEALFDRDIVRIYCVERKKCYLFIKVSMEKLNYREFIVKE